MLRRAPHTMPCSTGMKREPHMKLTEHFFSINRKRVLMSARNGNVFACREKCERQETERNRYFDDDEKHLSDAPANRESRSLRCDLEQMCGLYLIATKCRNFDILT